MHGNESLECKNKILNAFKDNTFSSEYFKKSDNAAYDFALKSVNEFTEEIKSMEENINLSLFEEFFESSSPANYAKMLINTKNADENKENVKEIENRILDLEDRIKEMNEKEKKNVKETLEIIRKTLDYNKNAQNFFHRASKVDKRKS